MTEPGATILTPRLRLDPLSIDDADGMMAVVGDARMYEFTGATAPTLEQLRARYRRLAVRRSPDGTERWLNWIVRFHGNESPVGVMQATVMSDGVSADVAWEVGMPWQGRGIASEGASAMVEWLAGQGVRTVSAHIHPDHAASAAVAAHAGLAATSEVVDGERVWRRSVAG